MGKDHCRIALRVTPGTSDLLKICTLKFRLTKSCLYSQWRRFTSKWKQRGSHARCHGSSYHCSRRYQESHVLCLIHLEVFPPFPVSFLRRHIYSDPEVKKWGCYFHNTWRCFSLAFEKVSLQAQYPTHIHATIITTTTPLICRARKKHFTFPRDTKKKSHLNLTLKICPRPSSLSYIFVFTLNSASQNTLFGGGGGFKRLCTFKKCLLPLRQISFDLISKLFSASPSCWVRRRWEGIEKRFVRLLEVAFESTIAFPRPAHADVVRTKQKWECRNSFPETPTHRTYFEEEKKKTTHLIWHFFVADLFVYQITLSLSTSLPVFFSYVSV